MDLGRILALDVGKRRTGVALSDPGRIIASPWCVIEASQPKEWLRKVLELLEQEEISEILVGLPLNHHGEAGADACEIRKYIALLREKVKVPVIEWDERFTTVQAERALLEADLSRKDRKKVIDKVAASITLQGYLDRLSYSARQNRSEEDDMEFYPDCPN